MFKKITLSDLAKPSDKMSWRAKRIFKKALKQSCKDQNKMLKEAEKYGKD